MTGKLADTVMSVRNGEQIARKYQPVVFNPSTPAQVAQRAKMKLLSQLSAVVAPGIGFSRQGSVSARNLFTKANFAGTSYDTTTEKASITLTSVDLTGGVVALPGITTTRSADKLSASLVTSDQEVDAVVYVSVAEHPDGKLRLFDVRVINTPGTGYTFETPEYNIGSSLSGFVLAYGIRYNTEEAKAAYGNLQALDPAAFIQIVRNSPSGSVTLTQTQGTTFTAYQGA